MALHAYLLITPPVDSCRPHMFKNCHEVSNNYTVKLFYCAEITVEKYFHRGSCCGGLAVISTSSPETG